MIFTTLEKTQNPNMPIPQNKDELISAIEDSYTKLKKELESIPVEFTFETTLDGHAKGTQMSISNLAAYLIGWGELVLKWHQRKDVGLPIDFPETGYKWNELGKLAQKFYADYSHLNYAELQQTLDQVVNRILVLIAEISNEDLYEKPWYDKWTQGRMIQLNTSSPYKNARSRIRKWKRENKDRLH
jgi:hypothetical protein